MMAAAVLILGGALLGLTWGNGMVMAAAVLLPLLWARADSRWSAGAVALAYYLAASRGLPHGAGIFFAATAPAWFGWALCFAVAVVNAAIWTATWFRDPARRAFGAPAALLLTALPPVGLIGWTNPITAAGILFPALGFIGVALSLMLAYVMAAGRREAVAIFAGAAVIANVCAAATPAANRTPGWKGLDTSFRQLQAGSTSNLNQRLQLVVELARKAPAGQVIVLPETLLPAADPRMPFASALLDDAAETLQAKGAVLLVGTELAEAGQPRQNVLMPLGDRSAHPLVQRVPVPVGMWRPWSSETYQADPLAGGIGRVAGKTVAFSICYEQVLVFPILRSMAARPDVIVGAANDWWARSTSIPAIQAQSLDAWGRLFGLQVVRATNT